MSQKQNGPNDTIVACATPPGKGAISVVRLSGQKAIPITDAMLKNAKDRQSHRLYRAKLLDAQGQLLDDAMIVEMKGPHSYSGEDIVELHVHGAPYIVESVIERSLELGARHAEPGEFSLRAFTHGKLGLDQAEAVADLIAACSQKEVRAATRILGGELCKQVERLLEALEGVLTYIRAAVDFPEQATGEGFQSQHVEVLKESRCTIQSMIDMAEVVSSSGRDIVLCGSPNVGKSTLLNAWVGLVRVLVDASPGTTRDPVEVRLRDGPNSWTIVDTAGIRDDAEGLEAQGIALSQERIATAEWLLWLVDPLQPTWPNDNITADLIIGGKADLADSKQRGRVEQEAREAGYEIACWVSGESHEGVDELKAHLAQKTAPQSNELVITRTRHLKALMTAEEALKEALHDIEQAWTIDVVMSRIEGSCRALGTIVGRDIDEDVLDRIFAEFCIGK
jgi:tRNA modification GTPase